MGTRGLKVYRFRKRYYVFYNHYDSYPEGLGKEIVADIPTDPSEYQAWLNDQRATAAKWEAQYEKYITVMPGNKINNRAVEEGGEDDEETPGEANKEADKNTGENNVEEGVIEDVTEDVTEDASKDGNQDTQENDDEDVNEETAEEPAKEVPQKKTSAFMEHQFPTFLTPMNDTYIEWVYTIDLDNEKFSIDNGAHFKLEMMPHIDWIAALGRGGLDKAIVLPGKVAEDAVVDLVAENPKISNDLIREMNELSVNESPSSNRKLVTPKGLDSFPWYIRHGAVLRSLVFYFWTAVKGEAIAASLLQLIPSDLAYRELAYALLCMAAGGKHMSVFPKSDLPNNTAFGFIRLDKNIPLSHLEFFSVLASGAHLGGEKPGSAPQETVYWLENVLVVLTAQLYDRGTVDEGITRVTQYCKAHHSDEIVDAVLMSIEHVVLVHVIPSNIQGKDAEIQHTDPLPLFDIEDHISMRATDRYTSDYLAQFANPEDEKFMRRQRKRKRAAMREASLNEGISMGWGDDEEVNNVSDDEDELLRTTQVEGSPLETFYALQHLFSAAARRQLRPNKTAQQGCFPTEIYECIVSHVPDTATRDACLHTSLVLREICLKQYLLCEADGTILKPCEACESCEEPGDIPKYWHSYDMSTREEKTVTFKRAGGFLHYDQGDELMILIGDGYGKKSLLPEVIFNFKTCNKPVDED